MSHIALARKWRPRTFDSLLGQDPVTQALTRSLTIKRLHHAYLFTGTRGVGKTSVARLFAKALNCETDITASPCLSCPACIGIEQGSFVDLIEIDGASKTRVEDTRDLLENVYYAPAQGRFKIYLIDEVHMLSQHSFNALLKTLEEPPAHVKFLLATTDPQKLPVTVLSRCLQFHLKPLTDPIITTQLQIILKDEDIGFEAEALAIIAKAADGSMRDALSLLDEALALSVDTIKTHSVKTMLGYTRENYALALINALASKHPQTLLSISQKIAEEGGNFHYVLEQMMHLLHDLSWHYVLQNKPQLTELSQQFTPELVQLLYQIALKSKEDIHLAPSLIIGFEMTLLRMHTFMPVQSIKESMDPVNKPLGVEAGTLNEVKKATSSEGSREEAAMPSEVQKIASTEESWKGVVSQLKLSGLSLNALSHSKLIEITDSVVKLAIEPGHQALFTPNVIARIEEAMTNYYNKVLHLELQCEKNIRSQKRDNLSTDPFFQRLQQEFSE